MCKQFRRQQVLEKVFMQESTGNGDDWHGCRTKKCHSKHVSSNLGTLQLFFANDSTATFKMYTWWIYSSINQEFFWTKQKALEPIRFFRHSTGMIRHQNSFSDFLYQARGHPTATLEPDAFREVSFSGPSHFGSKHRWYRQLSLSGFQKIGHLGNGSGFPKGIGLSAGRRALFYFPVWFE